MSQSPAVRADRTAAWAVGVGIGLPALMVSWLIGNRLLGLVLAAPEGPTVDFVAAIVIGVVTAAVAGTRLTATVDRDSVTLE